MASLFISYVMRVCMSACMCECVYGETITMRCGRAVLHVTETILQLFMIEMRNSKQFQWIEFLIKICDKNSNSAACVKDSMHFFRRNDESICSATLTSTCHYMLRSPEIFAIEPFRGHSCNSLRVVYETAFLWCSISECSNGNERASMNNL